MVVQIDLLVYGTTAAPICTRRWICVLTSGTLICHLLCAWMKPVQCKTAGLFLYRKRRTVCLGAIVLCVTAASPLATAKCGVSL